MYLLRQRSRQLRLHQCRTGNDGDAEPASGFEQSQRDVTAIQHWNRQEIQEGQVDVKHDTEPNGQPPALFTLKQDVINAENLDRAAQMLRFHI